MCVCNEFDHNRPESDDKIADADENLDEANDFIYIKADDEYDLCTSDLAPIRSQDCCRLTEILG